MTYDPILLAFPLLWAIITIVVLTRILIAIILGK